MAYSENHGEGKRRVFVKKLFFFEKKKLCEKIGMMVYLGFGGCGETGGKY